jgi:hypothetical protein
MTQEGVVSTGIERGPVVLPSSLAQRGLASLASPEVHEHAAAVIVRGADHVEVVVGAGRLHA